LQATGGQHGEVPETSADPHTRVPAPAPAPAPGRTGAAASVRRRRHALTGLLGALAVLVGVGIVVGVVLTRPGGTTGAGSPGGTTGAVRPGGETGAARAGAPAPTHVRLHDAGTSVLVRWDAPAAEGVSSFAVRKGPDGGPSVLHGEAGPDDRSYEVTGLDPGTEYCFAVTARYGRTESAPSPRACTDRGVRKPSLAASPATGARTAQPPPSRPGAAATPRSSANPVSTRIVSPSNGSRVAWPFTARFTVSAADAKSRSTVLALSICVAGRCYLDGELAVADGAAAPYRVRLGSTRPEGVGVAWTVRLDRLTPTTFARLVAERDAEIAASTWGDKGTTMSALNATPVSTLTVTKTA